MLSCICSFRLWKYENGGNHHGTERGENTYLPSSTVGGWIKDAAAFWEAQCG
ncbi:MAG: hypothetical protein NC409_09670 [Clostridium sp.]|nr:hypothetical protein [Clostridium sp.]